MAALVVESEYRGSMAGFSVYTALVTLSANETDAGTVDTGMSKVTNVQLTNQTSLTQASAVWAAVSGGTITIDADANISGTHKVWLFAVGHP